MLSIRYDVLNLIIYWKTMLKLKGASPLRSPKKAYNDPSLRLFYRVFQGSRVKRSIKVQYKDYYSICVTFDDF